MEIINHNKEYKTENHLIYSCQYHVIFCPKSRRNVLINGIDVRLQEILNEVAQQYEFKIVEMEVLSDYVHMIVL